jgi:hypothetical protein
MNRRAFLSSAIALPALRAEGLPAVRAITKGPKFHWFGYYDKLQFDPSSRLALGMEGDIEHRLPTEKDHVRLGYVDTGDGDRWTDIGVGHVWSWHQGCMLQWLPGSKSEVIYNDRVDGQLVSHIVDIRSGKRRTLPMPIYCVSPDARWGIVNDFRRSFVMRPETGYAGLADPYDDQLAPEKSGIWRMDLKSGKTELILSLAEVVAIPRKEGYSKGSKHYFDHLLFAPDGKRFIFFQRWRGEAEGRGFSTRMLSADANGKDVRVLDPYGKTSHYVWRDPKSLLVWMEHPLAGAAFYLMNEPDASVRLFAPDAMPKNGHPSFFRKGRWVVCDTSPDAQRMQHQYVYDSREKRKYELGSFHSPPEYTGYWRCDTTPRVSPDGRKVIIDSPHGGNGRQMYLIDISSIVG